MIATHPTDFTICPRSEQEIQDFKSMMERMPAVQWIDYAAEFERARQECVGQTFERFEMPSVPQFYDGGFAEFDSCNTSTQLLGCNSTSAEKDSGVFSRPQATSACYSQALWK
ncbi:Hypothetical_protein [Hexamita inflata]|uniref:Hypothetical_protein n=1 Tax=Hexamita inflata TaxID=28002 RepID=A0AA86UJY4_9EUKA|nr:Hypothetical protein HINF_LOCUS816 [Hexamita inflata]CAI9913176.1 Hypothetical protein HINF_LOCUS821 [Hexamita inflata]CAI9928442.1 Hypothetical protein HINF_LOCUS16087 [Hexamita inflata]CAI9954435.1 Hypothetical protein HINF_LOCUS42080 [Hexamita inflata]CAI9954440.1 Hypothetical protein HINF_LOCUS42085 [Hexamita inflata]